MPLFRRPKCSLTGLQVSYRGHLGVTFGSMASVTATGTSPPTVTLSGTPASTVQKILIEITTGGARGTAIFKWSSNDGTSYTTGVFTGASVSLGSTGITAAFATGTYSTDNVYSSRPRSSALASQDGSGSAARDLVQANSVSQPQYIYSDASFNNMATLDLAPPGGSSVYMRCASLGLSVLPVSTHYAVAILTDVTTSFGGTQRALYDGLSSTAQRQGIITTASGSQRLRAYAGGNLDSTVDILNVPFVIAVRYGTSGKIWVNSHTPNTGNSGLQSFSNFNLGLGASTQSWFGRFAALDVYAEEHDDSTVASHMDALGSTYAITISS